MQSLRLCLAKVFWHCSVESQQVLSTEKALKGYPQSSLIGEDVSWVLQTFDTCETINSHFRSISDTKPNCKCALCNVRLSINFSEVLSLICSAHEAFFLSEQGSTPESRKRFRSMKGSLRLVSAPTVVRLKAAHWLLSTTL